MEELINLSEDFLDEEYLYAEACGERTGRGCGDNLHEDEDYDVDDDMMDDEIIIEEDDIEIDDIEDDYENYSETALIDDFDSLLEAEEVEIDVHMFSEEMEGFDVDEYFL